jgi:hypothetical protein
MPAWLRSSLTAALIFGLSWMSTSLSKASTEIQVLDAHVEYTFGGQITIKATISSPTPIEHIVPFFRVENESPVEMSPLTPTQRGRITSVYDTNRGSIRAFSTITYWFEITFEDGISVSSPEFQFFYEDNRFDWQTRRDGVFRVHWYNNEADYIPEVLEVAQEGLLSSLGYVPVMPPDTIDIYIYDNAEDLQTALHLLGDAQIAGHADPALSVILVSLPAGPDQQTHMQQRIPHEIMHILTYQHVREHYHYLPAWLIEGLASIAELQPNPEFDVLLDDAYQGNRLLSISSLCQSFPPDPSSSLLAYAQSASFTSYLYNQYGLPGLLDLLAQYSPETSCEQGIQHAFGVRLNRLEHQWQRDSFPGGLWQLANQEILPWLLLLVAIMFAPLVLTIKNLISTGG